LLFTNKKKKYILLTVVASLSPCIVVLGVPNKNSSLGSSLASGCSWVKRSGDGVSTVSDNLEKTKNNYQS